jgi:succinate dehydrogenase, cytochrome b556 subunit
MHRISGVLLFLLLPFALYLLQGSLLSRSDFIAMQQSLTTVPMKILLLLLVASVAFHFMAGIRHMLMDCGLGESLKAAKRSAFLIMFLEIVAVIYIGVWLW